MNFFGKEHPFSLRNVQFALQRILWGFLKKLVIADRAAQVVTYIFGSYDSQAWFVVLFGLFMYAVELYADFAGGMDIALGVSELAALMQKNSPPPPDSAETLAKIAATLTTNYDADRLTKAYMGLFKTICYGILRLCLSVRAYIM